MKPEKQITYISVAEAASRGGVSAAAVYAWCGSRLIANNHAGGRIYIDEDSLRDFLVDRASRRRPKPRLRLVVNNG
jgi:hypothetical protein